MSIPDHGLDDPDYAAFAWGRYRRIMAWMLGLSVVLAAVMLGILYWSMGELPLLMAIFVAFGVFGTVALTAALMGLVFLSSGSGHDARVEDRVSKEVLIEDD
ncbi:hypothetical protein NYR55_07370 [Sphingomonas sp. BGYR3]|uniref:hypothetical protein n=1 Tax=Sphingomonas sp. BGYR3 TaxID=2975483 RepID=UPI0021A3DA1F|nr:hypothetical protein [Sphingomonas sp. BGYR3]MDG5488433.1 hypothetical protein [Sphingomonas sp. BGYR3]